MTPKEKAKEIFDNFYWIVNNSDFIINDLEDTLDNTVARQVLEERRMSKDLAVLCVREIIKEKQDCHQYECYGNPVKFWKKVKQEIEKL